MKSQNNLDINLGMNLLNEHPNLAMIDNPYQRFYIYRTLSNTELEDRDRCDTAKKIYADLDWYVQERDMGSLEPDTFFASSHVVIRRLMKKYDNKYYINSFKDYIEQIPLNYTELSENMAKHYRYFWMLESSTMKNYNEIITNPNLLDYIDSTHRIGNFMILPKGFGAIKTISHNDSPVFSLCELETNWNKYSNSYMQDYDFNEFKSKYLLDKAYLQSGILDRTLNIDFAKDSFTEIWRKMERISLLIHQRTEQILKRLNEKSSDSSK